MLKLTIAFALFAVSWGASDLNARPQLNGEGGGATLPERKFHYEVDIQHNGRHICSGAVLGKYDVLTAAQCIQGILPDEITILESVGTPHLVTKVQVHPLFDALTMDYDVALLKVRRPFEFGRYFDRVELAAPGDQLRPGDLAEVSGWVSARGSEDYSFMSTNMMIVPRDRCNETYGQDYEVSDRMLCTTVGHESTTPTGCIADPGSPLVVGDKLYGLASWGDACVPGSANLVVYTDASKLDYFVRRNKFIHEYAVSELCAALQLVVSLLPAIPFVPAWVVTALNLLLSLFC